MSGILRRTAFVDESRGYPLYHDYCIVETSLGPMTEFSAPFQRGDIQNKGNVPFTPSSESFKVDRVESLSIDKRPAIMKDAALDLLLQETSNYHSEY